MPAPPHLGLRQVWAWRTRKVWRTILARCLLIRFCCFFCGCPHLSWVLVIHENPGLSEWFFHFGQPSWSGSKVEKTMHLSDLCCMKSGLLQPVAWMPVGPISICWYLLPQFPRHATDVSVVVSAGKASPVLSSSRASPRIFARQGYWLALRFFPTWKATQNTREQTNPIGFVFEVQPCHTDNITIWYQSMYRYM